MKISEFEKYIVENKPNDQEFIKFIETLNETLKFDYNSTRKLTDEEIDYEYFDENIVEFIESSLGEVELTEEHSCSCDHTHEENHTCSCHHHDNEENLVQTEETRFLRSIKGSHILAMYLLREGLHYVDLVQEGLVGLAKANNLYNSNDEFEKNKFYFMAKEMIEYINSQCSYRRVAFKQYIENEREAEIKLKLSPKVRLKNRNEEIRRAEAEKKEEHKKEITRLEEITKNMFDYFELKYRLSIREIEALSLYFGLNGSGKKNFSDIEKIMKINLDTVDKLLKESIYKLSVVEEKIEI